MAEILRYIAANGFVKLSVIGGADIAEQARIIHGLSPTATAALGRTLYAASLLGNLLKEKEATLTIRISGGGPAGDITAVSDSEGNVRGCIENPSADLPTRADGKLDVGGIVGKNGTFTVSRDLGMREPYVGGTALVSGEIAEDLAAYLCESEQIGAACGLGVLVDTDFSVRAGGGFIVQLMPGAPEELTSRLEDNIMLMDQLTTILDEDGVEEVARQVLRDLEPKLLERDEVSYKCYCSRERIEAGLESIGADALEELAGEGEAEICCAFCGTRYAFSPEELGAMAGKVKNKKTEE